MVLLGRQWTGLGSSVMHGRMPIDEECKAPLTRSGCCGRLEGGANGC